MARGRPPPVTFASRHIDMNADEFVHCLGKTDDHPDILRLLARLGAKKPAKVPRGSTEVRVEVRPLGIEMLFKPIDDNRRHGLTFASVVFHGNGKPGAGALPFGLSFSDSRKDARKKVGPPMYISDELNRDAWDYQTHTMTADYARGRGRIMVLSLSMPFDPEDD